MISILAQADPGQSATDVFNILLQAGIAGAIVVGFITGLISPKTTVNAKDEQIALLKAQLDTVSLQRDRMIDNYESQVIPVLTQLNTELVPTLNKTAEVLKDHTRELRDLASEVRRSTSGRG